MANPHSPGPAEAGHHPRRRSSGCRAWCTARAQPACSRRAAPGCVVAGDRSRMKAAMVCAAFELDHHTPRAWPEPTLPPSPSRAAMPVVRVEHVDHAGHARLGGPAPRVAVKRHAAGGRAVVGAGSAARILLAAGRRRAQLEIAFSLASAARVGEEGRRRCRPA